MIANRVGLEAIARPEGLEARIAALAKAVLVAKDALAVVAKAAAPGMRDVMKAVQVAAEDDLLKGSPRSNWRS